MGKKETRRINPVSHLATFVVVIIVIVEILFIFNAVELKAETVKRIAPWAYESFLQLQVFIDQQADLAPAPPKKNSTITDFSSLIPGNLTEPVTATNDVTATETNLMIEPPPGDEIILTPLESTPATNAPASVDNDDMPAG